jgi:hypothetical protein
MAFDGFVSLFGFSIFYFANMLAFGASYLW